MVLPPVTPGSPLSIRLYLIAIKNDFSKGGKANYTENIAKESSMTRNDVAFVLDSVVEARLNQNRKERAEAVIDSFKSDTDKKKTDTSFWGYTIIGSVLVVGVCVALVLNRLKV